MAKKSKELGDYKSKIKKYFKENDHKVLSKNGLNLYLGINRQYIYDCRRRSKQKAFLKEYNKAIDQIENWLENGFLNDPKIKFEYWKLTYYKPEPIAQATNSNHISINLEPVRVIENE